MHRWSQLYSFPRFARRRPDAEVASHKFLSPRRDMFGNWRLESIRISFWGKEVV